MIDNDCDDEDDEDDEKNSVLLIVSIPPLQFSIRLMLSIAIDTFHNEGYSTFPSLLCSHSHPSSSVRNRFHSHIYHHQCLA